VGCVPSFRSSLKIQRQPTREKSTIIPCGAETQVTDRIPSIALRRSSACDFDTDLSLDSVCGRGRDTRRVLTCVTPGSRRVYACNDLQVKAMHPTGVRHYPLSYFVG
jgi:hypothetical protein